MSRGDANRDLMAALEESLRPWKIQQEVEAVAAENAAKDLRHPQSATAGPTVGTASDQTEPTSAVNATNTTGYGANGPSPLLWGFSVVLEGVTRLLWRLFL